MFASLARSQLIYKFLNWTNILVSLNLFGMVVVLHTYPSRVYSQPSLLFFIDELLLNMKTTEVLTPVRVK